MPTYKYICPSCSTEYAETRLPIHEQTITNCGNCNVEFSLVGEE